MDIPEIKRDGKLMSRLIANLLGGFDKVMDKESQLYLRLLARLIDKAYAEYSIVRECLIEEIKTNDRLLYRIEIVNHLENCVSAISRASKIMDKLTNGISLKGGVKIKKDLDIYKFISEESKKKIAIKSVATVRNRVEHIDEDIYLNKFKDKLFLDVTDDYKNIYINGKSISLDELVNMITIYHELVLEIFSRLPKKWENGKYYYSGIT